MVVVIVVCGSARCLLGFKVRTEEATCQCVAASLLSSSPSPPLPSPSPPLSSPSPCMVFHHCRHHHYHHHHHRHHCDHQLYHHSYHHSDIIIFIFTIILVFIIFAVNIIVVTISQISFQLESHP